MSLGSGAFFPVNTTTRGPQFESDNATSSNGSSVVVWTDTFSSTDHDIRAQRLNQFGGTVGPEIVVSFSGLDEGSPAVAMDSFGGFDVTWTQRLAPGGDTNVVAQRFDPNGNAVGALIQVGAGTFRESDPDVSSDRFGNFVVSYTRETNNSDPDIFAKQYSSSGQLLNVVNVAVGGNAQTHSSVAMTPDGRFDVAFEQAFSSSDHDIYLNRYSASGGLLGAHTISFSSSNDRSPSVSVDDSGNGVVAWERAGDIKAMRFTAAGTLGSELRIASTPNLEQNASVALKRSGGGFAVAYESVTTEFRTIVAEVSASDNRTTPFDAGVRSSPALSINASGDYLLTSTSSDFGDLNIRSRRGHLFF